MKLTPRPVEKPWGRNRLPPPFVNPTGGKIGEIWFEGQPGSNLRFLTKYIFTSERLSVQVHPSDLQARANGGTAGKTECWYILDTEPGAEIGLGLNRDLEADSLRAAAEDGSVMEMLNWLKVEPGDFFYVPAGTIHAIGAGVSLLEFQQNSDITYRLYDYGRPRELHLDEAVGVAVMDRQDHSAAKLDQSLVETLHSGDDFTFIKAEAGALLPDWLDERSRWVMPLAGAIYSTADEMAVAGECLLVEPGAGIRFHEETVALIGVGGRAEG